MAVQLESPRGPAPIGQRRAATRGTEPGGRAPVTVAEATPAAAEPSPPTKVLARRDDRAGALILFVAATLVMVLAVAVVGAVGRWWVLVPAMVLDLMLTVVVIAAITRLLSDDGESAASQDAR